MHLSHRCLVRRVYLKPWVAVDQHIECESITLSGPGLIFIVFSIDSNGEIDVLKKLSVESSSI